MKPPKNDSKYIWTSHAWEKMQHYAISEQRIKRIVRFPTRIEEGIAEDTIAAMVPAGAKGQQEIWVMYSIVTPKKSEKAKTDDAVEKSIANYFLPNKKIRIITAWRYPGKSSARDPIPADILAELRSLL
jgi:hypothetical protein